MIVFLFSLDPCYAAFHDEEWGVPVHDDKCVTLRVSYFLYFYICIKFHSLTLSLITKKSPTCRKLFELLCLSGALAELTWPAILNKRHLFRYYFTAEFIMFIF